MQLNSDIGRQYRNTVQLSEVPQVPQPLVQACV